MNSTYIGYTMIVALLLYSFQVHSSPANLTCQYDVALTPENETIYVCCLYDLNITANDIRTFNGTHLEGKNDTDVMEIRFENGTMLYIPNGIASSFPKVMKLMVGDMHSLTVLGTKAVTRLNFKNMTKLTEIEFVSNDIKKMDKDALWDLVNLEVFVLCAQRLNFLNVRTFERNKELRAVAILSTELLVVYENTFRYNFLLEKVAVENNLIETIHEGTFQQNPKLSAVSLRSNKITYLPSKLFHRNLLLYGVHFGDNSLEVIKIDFTKFKNISIINLEDNSCIDAVYVSDDLYRNVHHTDIRNLSQLQNLIRTKCDHKQNQ